jgi:hypothetical protein
VVDEKILGEKFESIIKEHINMINVEREKDKSVLNDEFSVLIDEDKRLIEERLKKLGYLS